MTATEEEIAGLHLTLYNNMFQEANRSQKVVLEAKEAADYLKRSHLSKTTLVRVWNEADAQRRGCLDKWGFFAALKLIALAQQGYEVAMKNITLNVNPPVIHPESTEHSYWTIQPEEMRKYEEIFENLKPVAGKLSGEQVKSVLFNSGLPTKTLGKIWQLSDIDRDGYLDKSEMILALHLVYRALENDTLPESLTPDMVPADKRPFLQSFNRSMSESRQFSTDSVSQQPPYLPSAIRSRACSVAALNSFDNFQQGTSLSSSPPLKTLMSRSLSGTPAPVLSDLSSRENAWPIDPSKWEAQFRSLDSNNDGFVTGDDVREYFLQTGLVQKALVHIWNLCDIKCVGRLNLDQFALAMHLVELKRSGDELPVALPFDLLPPSFRPISVVSRPDSAASSSSLPAAGDQCAASSAIASSPFSKEMEQIKLEIEGMQMEKRELEAQIVQSEADMKIKEAEIRNLQAEFNSLEATIGQLKRQKVTAKQRLEELDAQKISLEQVVSQLKEKVEAEEKEWNDLREKVESVCQSSKRQQDEIEKKQLELKKLRQDEHEAEESLNNQRSNLMSLSKQEADYEANIEKLGGIVDKLKSQRQLLAEQLTALSEGVVPPHLMQMFEKDQFFLPPLESVAPPRHGVRSNGVEDNGHSPANVVADPFVDADPFAQIRYPSSQVDPFPNYQIEDPFQDSAKDPFAGNDFVPTTLSGVQQAEDPFQPCDNPLGENKPFTFDPWAGAEQPSLPTTQKKKPPPRPALPTGHMGDGNNPFNNTNPTNDQSSSFANFADFSKFA